MTTRQKFTPSILADCVFRLLHFNVQEKRLVIVCGVSLNYVLYSFLKKFRRNCFAPTGTTCIANRGSGGSHAYIVPTQLKQKWNKTAKIFYGCFRVFVLVFCVKYATAETKHCLISVLFQLWGSPASSMTDMWPHTFWLWNRFSSNCTIRHVLRICYFCSFYRILFLS